MPAKIRFPEGLDSPCKFKVADAIKVSLAACLTPTTTLSRVNVHKSPQSIVLPITTRGVGFGLAYVYKLVSSNQFIEPPSIYSIYRASLAILEAKTENAIGYNCTLRQQEECYSIVKSAGIHRLTANFKTVLGPLKRLVNAVGPFEHSGLKYVPSAMRNIQLRDGIQPRPENILISNLREKVVALSDELTSTIRFLKQLLMIIFCSMQMR